MERDWSGSILGLNLRVGEKVVSLSIRGSLAGAL